MPLSAAERQQRYRDKQKLSEETLKRYKQKKHEYYMKDRKPITSVTEREKRHRRRGWKKAQKNRRNKIKNIRTAMRDLQTPVSASMGSYESGDDSSQQPSSNSSIGAIRQRYLRQINHLKSVNKHLTSRVQTTRKQNFRLKKRGSTSVTPATPRSKSDFLMSQYPSKIKKTLVFHHALIDELQASNTMSRSYQDKQILSKVLSGKILKKYKLLSVANSAFGLRSRQFLRNENKTASLHYIPRQYARFSIDNVNAVVEQFFMEDINSRASAGKNETITRNKERKQKRYLCDSIKNLHKKFCVEKGPISYSSFRKRKPFWVVQAIERDTCACKKCENIKLKVKALHRLGELNTQDVAVLLAEVRCSLDSHSCMYNECKLCRSKSVSFTKTLSDSLEISWSEWISKTDKRVRQQADGIEKIFVVHIVVKERITLTVNALKERLCSEMKLYSIHAYNIRHQYKQLKDLREQLKNNECVILVDFSENYATKYATEIQSMHFGASRNQVTLHTGVYYTAGDKISFCTIAQNNRHDPAAIWAHLGPILTAVKARGCIDTIHFISDSPSTQYRSVKNLYLMRKLMHHRYGFAHATWNFTESSHGKGPADGVGGLIKRTAYSMVNLGSDIPDATSLFNCLNGKLGVDLFMISEEDILNVDKIAPTAEELKTYKLPGIMKVHQVRSSAAEAYIEHRVLSCFCKPACNCLDPVKCWNDMLSVAAESVTSAKQKTRKPSIKQPSVPAEPLAVPKIRKLKSNQLPSSGKKSSKIPRVRPLSSDTPLPRPPTWLTEKKMKGICYVVDTYSLIIFVIIVQIITI